MDRGEFISKYTVHFGPLPADLEDKIQLKEWGMLVEMVRADKLDTIIEKVSASIGNATRKPRIRDFRAAMRDMEEPNFIPDGQGCALCDGTGFMVALGWIDSNLPFHDKNRYRLGHVGNNSRLYTCATTCKCTKGRNIAIKSGIKPDAVERAIIWCDGFRNECQLVGRNVSDRMKELVYASIEQFGVWPTPGNMRKAARPSELPQEATLRPMATSTFRAPEVAPATTADESGPDR